MSAGTPAPAELCGNSLDDDCDGSVDEGFAALGTACSPGVGICQRTGQMICDATGLMLQCSVSSGSPGPLELCGNTLDDDCDGMVDEGYATVGSTCAVGLAPCRTPGTFACSGDRTSVICDLPPTVNEFCNGLDDDNDSCIDEDFSVGTACSAGQGVCRRNGMEVCNSTGSATICNVTAGPPNVLRRHHVSEDGEV